MALEGCPFHGEAIAALSCGSVPSAKRERQRANREMKRAAIAEAQTKRKRTRQVVVSAVAVVAVVALSVLIFGGGSASKKAGVAPCPAANGSSPRRNSFSAPPPMCISRNKSYTAVITTTLGTITASLDANSAPVTVNDFVYLARYHFYDGLTFHRVIKGFVDQTGAPGGNPAGGPGYTVQGEVPKAGAYRLGSLAMAKTSAQPNGASGSQFFIVAGPQGEQLPPDYSLFGQVTKGMSVVEAINADGSSSGTPAVLQRIKTVKILTGKAAG